MKKKHMLVAVLLLLAVMVTGCTKGSYTFLKSNEKSGNSYWNASYEQFNGYKQREVSVSGDGEHAFTVAIVTTSGTLGLVITDKDGNTLYTGSDIETSTFDVQVDTAGKYIVKVEADNHQGSFDIQWE